MWCGIWISDVNTQLGRRLVHFQKLYEHTDTREPSKEVATNESGQSIERKCEAETIAITKYMIKI